MTPRRSAAGWAPDAPPAPAAPAAAAAPPDGTRPRPRERPLKVYAFDPSLGQQFGNHLTLHLPFETLAPGPVGRLVAVVDTDDAAGVTYPPVDLDDPTVLMGGGIEPSEINLGFHQQMAYAVAMHTIRCFEIALGRSIVWPWAEGKDPNELAAKLRILPHAEEVSNAHVFTDRGEMRCGYFRATADDGRWNLPGQYVYSCLCFGVMAHEISHPLVASVLDGSEAFRGDGPAFLEALCDLVALLQRFTFPEVLVGVVHGSRGRIHDVEFQPDVRPEAEAAIMAEVGTRNPLLELARQFGEAIGMQNAIRTALTVPPGSRLADAPDEPHAKGAILVAAVFDAFFTVYARRTRDLLRLAGPHAATGDLHPDLARRLAAEGAKTAGHLLTICIRALDYLPPVGFDFGDYLRAMVTADHDCVPDDGWGYRAALVDAFRSRGIYPSGVPSSAEEALRWPRATVAEPCGGLRADADTPEERAQNRKLALAFAKAHRSALGLPRGGLRVVNVHTSQRAGSLGVVQRGFSVQVVSGSKDPNRRSGATLVLDEAGHVSYVVAGSKMPAEPRPHVGALPTDGEGRAPQERPLKIFAFDPSRGRALGNHLTVRLPYEKLDFGPVGARVAVIDYDASNDVYYRAVDLDDPVLLMSGGLEPSESDPQFHQQMVYAVASETVRRFEFALGRPIRWRWSRIDAKRKIDNTLRVFPHAMQEANAYFDPNLHALLFGYFEATAVNPESNMPGQAVFTCLSHDIVAHETTHALLDTLKRRFLEPSGLDVLAFHEAFADIVALLQHFSFKDALVETIVRTGGRIHAGSFRPAVPAGAGEVAAIQAEIGASNPMVELARQFGEAIGTRAALRAALGTPPNTSRLAEELEPHGRGAILVAAVFDAFFSVYLRRSEDLLRLAEFTPGADGYMHPDLADRLAREAAKTARHFLNICVRALDYCPPVDIEFGDFLRAIVTADAALVPDDPYGYRAALIDAFRSRGIYPRGARSFSEDGLLWPGPAGGGAGLAIDKRALGGTAKPTGGEWDRRAENERTAAALHAFATANAPALGLAAGVTIAVSGFYPGFCQRADPKGSLHTEFVAQFVQSREERLFEEDAEPTFKLWGGTTVIFDENGNLRSVAAKSLDDPARLASQREFLSGVAERAPAAPFVGPFVPKISLAALHRGYGDLDG